MVLSFMHDVLTGAGSFVLAADGRDARLLRLEVPPEEAFDCGPHFRGGDLQRRYLVQRVCCAMQTSPAWRRRSTWLAGASSKWYPELHLTPLALDADAGPLAHQHAVPHADKHHLLVRRGT